MIRSQGSRPSPCHLYKYDNIVGHLKGAPSFMDSQGGKYSPRGERRVSPLGRLRQESLGWLPNCLEQGVEGTCAV